MQIKTVSIKNFRNFEDFQTELELFTIIIGANNSGKSNFFDALRKILSISSLRNSNILYTDFKDPTQPVVIGVVFNNLTEHDLAAFYGAYGGLIEPEYTLTIRFTAEWESEEQDVVSDVYFVRGDLNQNQQRVEFIRRYRDYIATYFTSIAQSQVGNLSLSKRQSFGRIIRAFAGDYLKPINVLLLHLTDEINQFLDDVQSTEILTNDAKKSTQDACKSLIAFCKNPDNIVPHDPNEEAQVTTDFNNLLEDFRHFKKNKLEIVSTKHEIGSIIQQANVIDSKLDTLQLRLLNRDRLRNMSKALQIAKPFDDARTQFSEVFEGFFLNQNFDFQMLSIDDEELIGSISAILDDFPLSNHGDGYKSLFDIGIGLVEVLASEDLKDKKSSITCLFIEQLETNLAPHMQRHVINCLKDIQENWAASDRHLQIIITTHAPTGLKKIEPEELIQLREEKGLVRAIKWQNDTLEKIAANIENDESKRYKKFMQLQKVQVSIFERSPELLFSKVVIIVEGDSELGFISTVIENLSKPDYYGMIIINAGGGDKIPDYVGIISGLDIKYVCVADSGDEHIYGLSLIPSDCLFLTTELAFETEIIAMNVDDKIWLALDDFLPTESMKKTLGSVRGLGISKLASVVDVNQLIFELGNLDDADLEKLRKFMLKRMKKAKGVEFGRLLGKKLDPQCPEVYRNAIEKAEEFSKQES